MLNHISLTGRVFQQAEKIDLKSIKCGFESHHAYLKLNTYYDLKPMKFRISTSYNWYQTDSERFIVKVYYMNGIEFTFDELPKIAQQDPEIIKIANNNTVYTPEIFFRKSFYLIDEECHPCLFPVDLENPEDMPDELIYNSEEDLSG